MLKGKSSEEIEDLIFKFIIFQKERISRKEIGPETLTNYMKSIKLFCKMNRINVFWNIEKTIIPSNNKVLKHLTIVYQQFMRFRN